VLSNVLIIHNSSTAQSLTDAQSYVSQRGLKANYLGVNWGTSQTFPTKAQMTDGTYTIQSLTWDNVSDSSFNGKNLGAATGLKAVGRKYPMDGVILSTYTPMTYEPSNGSYQLTVPGAMGLWLTAGSDSDVGVRGLPNGRLGCPLNTSSQFFWTTEMTTRSGQSAFTQCVGNAIAAESTYNLKAPHFSSTATGVNGGATILSTGASFFNASYYTTLMAAIRAKCSWTVDLGADYPFMTVGASDFLNGVTSSPLTLFALVGSLDFNNPTSGGPGGMQYSNNYRVVSGGWTAVWFSNQFYWALDFIYNGGSTVFTTINEPFSDGIRDPATIFNQLAVQQLSMMECTAPLVGSTLAYQNTAAVSSARLTVVGDPLYRPYLRQTPNPAAITVPGIP
jgi:hypothetical protein